MAIDAHRSGPAPRPLRGPFSRWPAVADAGLAVVILILELGAVATRGEDSDVAFKWNAIADVGPLGVVLLVLGSGALVFRRKLPLQVLLTTVGTSILWSLLVVGDGPLLANLVALYGTGRYLADSRQSVAAAGVTMFAMAIVEVVDGEVAATIGVALLVMFIPWYVGRRLRIRGEYLGVLEERAQWVEKEREADLRRAAADERSRIARELHDVVAHRVSMMTVQAGAAGMVAADDPGKAVSAMHAVEAEGREALGELRHLLGVLRPDGGSDSLQPHHGIGDVPDLVASLVGRGMDITMTDTAPRDIPARVGLSAYRIVQEALTNVLKHAGPDARAEVRLATAGNVLVVEVVDDGNGRSVLPGSGHGIVGMRERAALLGGEFEAKRRPGGGFKVSARLPMEGEGR